MKTLPFLLAVLSLAGEAVAQIAVQLPNYSSFSVNTTVVVPDRGGMWIGGGGHSSFGGLRSAPPGQMLRTVRQGATGVGVAAWVHDHTELDRATLAKAGRTPRATSAPASWIGDEGAPSIAALRRQRAAEQQQFAVRAAMRREATEALRAARVARAKSKSLQPPKLIAKPGDER